MSTVDRDRSGFGLYYTPYEKISESSGADGPGESSPEPERHPHVGGSVANPTVYQNQPMTMTTAIMTVQTIMRISSSTVRLPSQDFSTFMKIKTAAR